MAVSNVPIYVQTPFIASGQVSAANTNRDGTGTIATITTGTTNGRRISKITIKAIVTTTAGQVRFYIDDTVNVRLIKEVVVAAITVGAAVAGFVDEALYSEGLILPNGYILKASTVNAEAMNIIVEGADY